MTHITLSKKTNSKPCLEFYSDGSGEARRVSIEHFPFRIGRAESADLRIESVEVSREHVEINERNGICLVRDLGSTNGTQVNGKPITETLIADGDILKVAEVELTFIGSPAAQFQRMVTQPIHSKKMASAPCALPPEIAAMRMLAEATLWQAFPSQLLVSSSLRHGTTEAYFSPLTISAKEQPIFDHPNALIERYRELERMAAVESAIEHGEARRLFLAVGAADIESPHRIFASLKQLQGLLPSSWELGITISLPTDIDILQITEIYQTAREHELLVAYDEFQGNGAQVMHFKSLLPDYVVLAPNMMKDLTSLRQPLRRLESLLAACEELAVKPVLPRNSSDHAIARCQQIGFDLILLSARCKAAAPPLTELSVTV